MSGGGGTSVSTPPVDPAQQALERQQAQMLQQQTAILQQQQSDQKIIAPVLYQSMGLTPTYDEQGNLTSLTQNPLAAQNYDTQLQVNASLLKQEQDAISGKLPVNPLVTSQLASNEQTLHNTLSANIGPGYAASTPGQQAQGNFDVNKAGIIQAANTGQMTLDQQLAAAGQNNANANIGATLSGVSGVNSLGFNLASAYGATAQGYGFATQPYQQQSQTTLQAEMANSQAAAAAAQGQGAMIGAGIGAVGAIAGGAIIL